MITTLLIATGITAWGLLALLIGLSLLHRPRIRRWLERPSLYAHTAWLAYRLQGAVVAAMVRLRLMGRHGVAPEVIAALRSARLDDLDRLRDVLRELEELPTIRNGLTALGLKSIFEVPSRAVHQIRSPYTDRMQRPSYYLPGVPARAFYEPSDFPWVKPLEEAFPTIKRELANVLRQDGEGFKAYMSEGQVRLEGWNTFNFFFYGKKFEENCALCPKTAALLESLPRFERDHIMFSALNPHSHIPPHTGPMNGIIRGHLAMTVPAGCYIRVGKDERTWEEGKVLVFDDSFEHEVWNHGDHVRIVLFMNFWHPCFSAQEIAVLERFRTAYEQSPAGRVHEDNQAARRAHDLAMKAIAAGKAATGQEQTFTATVGRP
jgi:aspartyl/asparaginyl beta-hydroxylase (cupin superfamily)